VRHGLLKKAQYQNKNPFDDFLADNMTWLRPSSGNLKKNLSKKRPSPLKESLHE